MSNHQNITIMKKIMITLVALLTMSVSTHAMSYEQARNEALFLTDKMAYELNLTDEQYEAAYEINLDYLMGVTSVDDVYGPYWERRNLDLSYILLEAQWNAFINATYFYRPLYWDAGYWHFGIYARYPHRDYFYFGRPHFYATYRGGHAWHRIGGHGYYYGRRDHFRPAGGHHHIGMRDNWRRGDYRTGHRIGSTHMNGGRHYGGGTIGPRNHGNGTIGPRNHGGGTISPRNNGGGTIGPRNYGGGTIGPRNYGGGTISPRNHGSGTIGSRPGSTVTTPRNNTFGGGSRIGGTGTHGGGSHFGAGTGTRGGGSHGGGHFGGGGHSGGHGGGGGHFGSRR